MYGSLAHPPLLEELAQFYSRHYGRWSPNSEYRPGHQIKLTADMLRGWLKKDSRISLAKLDDQVVGYAISIQTNQPWDSHEDIRSHRGLARSADPAIASLVSDLRARGLFDQTVLIIASEFGRTPMVQSAGQPRQPGP
jgi:hypothetical protein